MKKRIIFRLPDRTYEQAKQAMKKGEFKNLSQLLRTALTEFLETC